MHPTAEMSSGSVGDIPVPLTVAARTPWAKAASRNVMPKRASTSVVPVSDSVAVRLSLTRRSAVTPFGSPVTLAAPVLVRLVPL